MGEYCLKDESEEKMRSMTDSEELLLQSFDAPMDNMYTYEKQALH